MQIRQRLTFQFIFVVAFILLLSSISIYFFSADYRKDDFYLRLQNKAYNTAKLLIEVDEVDASLLRRIERDNPVSLPNERISIFSGEDELLYTSDEGKTLTLPADFPQRIRDEGEIRFRQKGYEILGFAFSDAHETFVVIAGAEDIYGKSKLRNLRTVLIIVFGVSILLVFLSGWIYAGRALQPISRVIDQVDDITITSLNLRVAEGKENDEISKLAHTFNNMLERLETAFKVQKNFIANASHELRTPLTTITGQLEVALMNTRTNDEYQQIMESVLEDIKNLNTTSNRLLLLAQASSETSEIDFGALRIDDVVWQSTAELRKRNPEYRISVSLDDGLKDDTQLTIIGNEQLVKTVILNLTDNGCKYAENNQVRITIKPERHAICLLFTDAGIGIEPADLPHIFEPFYRGKNAGITRGHGIGLSLVERIIRLHKGRISVESTPGKGTTFCVTFPLRHF